MPLFGKKPKKEELLWEYKAETPVRGFRFSADNLYLAGYFEGRRDKPSKVYFFTRSELLLWSHTAKDAIFEVSLSADGTLIAAGSFDENVYLLNRSGKPLWSYKIGSHIRTVSISPDGSFIAAGADDKGIYVFDRSGQLLWNYGITGACYDISFPADASMIPVRAAQKIYLFRHSGELLWEYDSGSEVRCISLSADGSLIVGAFNTVNSHICNLTGNLLYNSKIFLLNNSGQLLWSKEIDVATSHIYLSADGSLIVVSSYERDLVTYNYLGQLLWRKRLEQMARSASLSADGSFIATHSANKAYLFDRSGHLLWNYKLSKDVVDVSLSADASLLVAGTWDDSKVYLFDVSKILHSQKTQKHPKGIAI